MKTLVIKKECIGGEFQRKATLRPGKKKTPISLEIGGGLFGKKEGEYKLPEDLLSYKFQFSERTKESLTKNLLKWGVMAVAGELAVGSGMGKTGRGAGAALMGAASVRMGVQTKNSFVETNFQFTDRKILTLEMKYGEWFLLDEELCILGFPTYEKTTLEMKEMLNEQIEQIRDNFASLSASDQKEATKALRSLQKQIPNLDSLLETRRKKARKRKII